VRVCVVALGKIGLPLAVQCASKGHEVIGSDINPSVVQQVNEATVPFHGEAFLAEKLESAVATGHLRATTDTSAAVARSDAVIVVVPVYVDDNAVPDFGWIDDATRAIAKGLQPGTLVAYETTLPVGTTRERFTPMLAEGSGLTAGSDFFVVFSPERVFSGRIFADLRRYPKLVGGIDTASTQHGVAFYESILDFDSRPDLGRENGVWALASAEEAEFAKLAETTYRDVNIALANQFARYADAAQIDVYRVIEAANSQPFSHIHRPGIAVGGHCIPVYPRFYLWRDPAATVVRAAREANAAMPDYAVDLLAEAYGDLRGAHVVVLGAAYRAAVKETAFSGVFTIVEALDRRGADPVVHDPMYTDEELRRMGLVAHHLGAAADAVVLHTDHVEYRGLGARDFPGVRAVIDGRRVLDPERWQGVSRRVIGVG
jgi:nucleotide sugar dehydrogenase